MTKICDFFFLRASSVILISVFEGHDNLTENELNLTFFED